MPKVTILNILPKSICLLVGLFIFIVDTLQMSLILLSPSLLLRLTTSLWGGYYKPLFTKSGEWNTKVTDVAKVLQAVQWTFHYVLILLLSSMLYPF